MGTKGVWLIGIAAVGFYDLRGAGLNCEAMSLALIAAGFHPLRWRVSASETRGLTHLTTDAVSIRGVLEHPFQGCMLGS